MLKYTLLMPLVLIILLSGTADAQNENKGMLGKTNIHALIEAVPTVPLNVQAAVLRAYGNNIISPPPGRLETFYKPIRDKVEFDRKELVTYYNDKKEQAYGSETGMQQQMKKEINQNEIIANMGGIDAISKMSSEEAERAAKKAVEQFTKNNQGQVQGKPNNGMLAKEMANKNKSVAAIQLNQKLSAIQLRIQQLNEALNENLKSLKTEKGNFDELNAKYSIAFNKIPLVTLGELRDKDPEKVKLLIADDVLRHRERNEYELKQTSLWFNDTKAKVKLAINDYYDLLADYKKNYSNILKQTNNGVNVEVSLAQFESDLMSEANYFADISEKATEKAARMEQEQFLRIKP